MLKAWQFNVLFFVGVGGAVLLLLGPEFGIEITSNPTAATGVGAILAYVLTQKYALTKQEVKKKAKVPPIEEDDEDEEE